MDEIRRTVSDMLTAHGSVLAAAVTRAEIATMTERPALAEPFYSKKTQGGKQVYSGTAWITMMVG